jgi:hypothetical protein
LSGNLTVSGDLTATGQVVSQLFPLLTKTEAEGLYVKKTGDTILGDLIVNGKNIDARILVHANDNTNNRNAFLELRSGNANAGGYSAIQFSKSAGDFSEKLFIQNASGANLMSFDGNGNVGIGTTTPEAKLAVEASSDEEFKIGQVSGTGSGRKQLVMGYNIAGNYAGIQAVEQNVAFRDLVLQSKGGNVGIGTTEPNAKLDVSGDIRLTGNIIPDGDICIGRCN